MLFVREDSPVGEVDADAEAFGDADGEAVVEVVAAGRSLVGAFLEEEHKRGSLLDVKALKDLARLIDVNTSKRLCIDVNLYLARDPIPASNGVVPLPPRSSQPRARTATVIQEEALEDVVAANLIGQGATLATCWRPRSGLPDKTHYPVNPNIITMWAKAVNQQQCTISEPNNHIKSAIMRARERSEIDKVRKQQQQHVGGCGGGGVLDEVRELQKSVLMAQLTQLSGGLAANQLAGW
ncbi:uncharacterized protein M421DRAFT_8072 [Didymella exigua CBS 183.55]|uniref:Uncharacterized protein n=1 Tax=Didymella exigua CBS 183.55 TaxID=1150837 RepID=A0A6A5RCG6_9PLEO|nr:uncharacterized protein M421DRAFT_8072 [Didymella exigua CBS 183.55]KAF1925193.1 hypothetical protein M421DRAFT_8072 [Didymella exigua CBS 183.55]